MFNLLIRLKIIHIYDLPQIRVDYSILVFFLQCKVSHTKPKTHQTHNKEMVNQPVGPVPLPVHAPPRLTSYRRLIHDLIQRSEERRVGKEC